MDSDVAEVKLDMRAHHRYKAPSRVLSGRKPIAGLTLSCWLLSLLLLPWARRTPGPEASMLSWPGWNARHLPPGQLNGSQTVSPQ